MLPHGGSARDVLCLEQAVSQEGHAAGGARPKGLAGGAGFAFDLPWSSWFSRAELLLGPRGQCLGTEGRVACFAKKLPGGSSSAGILQGP